MALQGVAVLGIGFFARVAAGLITIVAKIISILILVLMLN